MMTADLHPGLAPAARALDRVAPILPVETARARAQLTATLSPITRSVWPEISHRLSLLTNTGIPVELSWSTRHAALRWTAEVAGPETPKEERLAIARQLAGVECGWLEAMQAGRHLRYGAWLGGRHLGDGDELKVYGEVPAGLRMPVHHPVLDVLEDLDLEWRIAGVATDGVIELYGRGPVDRDALDRCERAAFGTTGEHAAAVTRLAGTATLPRPALYSVSVRADGAVDSLTWFAFAERLFAGHDETVAALERQCDDDTVVRLLHALTVGADDGRWRLGLLGARLGAAGVTSVQAAIRPS